jgi:HAD superfamily hydrolase (TIGR01509 family)
MKTILVDAVDTFVIEGEGVYKAMYDLLEQYPNNKIIVSNANDEEIVPFSLTNLPYVLYTLKHNPDKTDPKFFQQLFQYFNLEPNNVVYFEHNPDAVKSAQSLGITSYYYDPVKKDLDSLKIFLDENALD